VVPVGKSKPKLKESNGSGAAECQVAPAYDIGVARGQFHQTAFAIASLAGDQRGTRSTKQVRDHVAGLSQEVR
jgi:hypothetical protein